jgi:hypothetical protein
MTQTTVISGSTPETVTVEVGIDPTSNTTQYPIRNNEGSGPERIRTADVFLFTPIQLLEVNFKQVKPSVTASDKGKVGPVRWRYSVTAALTSFHLKLIDPWPIEFEMSLPFEITGQAAAGVKIGCINYEAVGAMFHGDVDPFKIRFKIELDWRSRQIVFVSKIHDIKAHGFQFSTFPQMDFPLTQILDYILARAAEFVVSKQADRILNITRIPIADLRIMEKIAEIVPNALAGETDTKGNATMGLKFKV